MIVVCKKMSNYYRVISCGANDEIEMDSYMYRDYKNLKEISNHESRIDIQVNKEGVVKFVDDKVDLVELNYFMDKLKFKYNWFKERR